MSKKDDPLSLILSGTFWTSAAIGTNCGLPGCLFAIIWFVWCILILGFGVSLMKESPDQSIGIYAGIIICAIWCFVTLKFIIKLWNMGVKHEQEMEELRQKMIDEQNELKNR